MTKAQERDAFYGYILQIARNLRGIIKKLNTQILEILIK